MNRTFKVSPPGSSLSPSSTPSLQRGEPKRGCSTPVLLLALPQPSAAPSAPHTERFLSGHAVTTLFYLLRRNVGADEAHELLAHLLARLKVAPITDAGVREALARRFKELEDAVTVAAAEEAGATVIVTRNPTDFERSTVPAVLPEVFLVARP